MFKKILEALKEKEKKILNEILSEHNVESFHEYENPEANDQIHYATQKSLKKVSSLKPKLERKNDLNQQNYEVFYFF